MDKNIIFLKKIFDSSVSSNFDLKIFNNFLNFYLDKNYIEDAAFLKFVDISKIIEKDCLDNFKFDYKKKLPLFISNNSCILVFLNGNLVFVENLSDGIDIGSSSIDFKSIDDKILNNLNIFLIFNLFLNRSVNFINIRDNFNFELPIYVINFVDGKSDCNSIFSTLFLNIGNNVNVNILESYFSLSDNIFINSFTKLFIGHTSLVNYMFLNSVLNNSVCSHSSYSNISFNSKLNYSNYSFGANYFKTYLYFFLLDKFSKVFVTCSRFLKLKKMDDINLKVFHFGNDSVSRCLFKSVLSDFSNCNFNGLIDVEFDTLNVDAGLVCKGLSLNDGTSLKLVPELSIKNNDVKCFHGATIGFLDDNIMFYFSSRGFNKRECITFLINAFFSDVVYNDSIKVFNVFDFLSDRYMY